MRKFIIKQFHDVEEINDSEFICNKLNSTRGTEFTARYINRFHELEEGNITTSLMNTLNSMVENLNKMNNRLTKLEEKSITTATV